MGNKYIKEFFSFRCASDIQAITYPVTNMEKELTEAMAVRRLVKNIVLGSMHPKLYTHIDLCSGNALAPILTAFTLPVYSSIAVDVKERDRDYYKIKNFDYRFLDILDENNCSTSFLNPVILSAVHACGKLAERVVEIFNMVEAPEKHLVLMPCCINKKVKRAVPEVILDKLGSYLVWCNHLYNQVDSEKKNILIDNNIESPCNALVVAHEGSVKNEKNDKR